MSITQRQREVFEFIVAHKAAHRGNAPTTDDIMAACHIKSKSGVNYHIIRLAAAGLITYLPNVDRSLEVVGGVWTPPAGDHGAHGPMYAHIVTHAQAHDGNAPSGRELMPVCGVASSSTVNRRLQALAAAGLIERQPFSGRAIEVIGATWRLAASPFGAARAAT